MLIDASKDWIESAQRYFGEELGENTDNVKIVNSFVTAENINKTLTDNYVRGEIDLLSIDIDGNDYWVWDSIDIINPRVVVIEYNAAFGDRSLTIKYNPHSSYNNVVKEYPLYFGASLKALTNLAKSKGYILVACDVHGHDTYFVRDDVAEGNFIETTPKEAFYPNPYTLEHTGNLETQFEQIKHLDLEEIEDYERNKHNN